MASLLAVAAALAFSDITVTLEKGTVRGTVVDGRGVFHGIPFAKPPVGQRRYMPPEEEEGWEGVIGGSRPVCVQPGSEGTGGPKGWDTIHVEESSEDCLYLSVYAPMDQAEANGTSTERPSSSFLPDTPVLVYFHAGEFLYGSSNDDETNFPWFSRRIILVTPNSRLGVFGFGAHPLLAERNPQNTTGNYGMQDQRLALSWVQKNIRKFGGDPDRVTILGESSGGTAVAYHLTNPRSWGLFSRAVAQSPGLYQTQTYENAAENTEFLATQLAFAGNPDCHVGGWRKYVGMTVDTMKVTILEGQGEESARSLCANDLSCRGYGYSLDRESWMLYWKGYPVSYDPADESVLYLKWITNSSLVSCLMSADPLVAMNISGYAFPNPDDFWTDQFCPVADGVELTDSIPGLFVKGQIAPSVSVIMGSNLDEATMMMYHVPDISCSATYEDFIEWGNTFYTEEYGATIAAAYKKIRLPIPQCENPSEGAGEWRAAAIRVAGDDAILCPLKIALNAISHTLTSHAYHYYFTHTPSLSRNYESTRSLGSFHGAEVPYVFGYPHGIGTEAEWTLHHHISAFWWNFMATGNPNSGLAVPITWPLYTPSEQHCLVLDTPAPTIETFVQSQQCNVFAAVHSTPSLTDKAPCPSRGIDTPYHTYNYSRLTLANVFVTTFLSGLLIFIILKYWRMRAPASPSMRLP
eukprot:TRINITY_DN2817_c0_g2_i1.p1 TRINITY_DN2817_c0_g2~~TRINITY_DN2817_c0_g2_i1.p1  ORF type:complete len:692 (+),score=89.81 TRINITY_DN2817_c0_g2_i1:35-2110(+)